MAGPSNPSSPPAKSPSPANSPSPAAPADVSSPAPEQEGALVADENPEDDIYNLGIEVDGESDTTSLKSSILKYRQENGRTYHSYKDGSYLFPNDAVENERMDLQHTLFLITFDDRLHVAPLKTEPHRVLDVGTGTGIWAIEYADEHPESIVTGIDLSPIQPGFVPTNCYFFVDDVEDDWEYTQPFDFIYSRIMTGSMANWPRFFKQSYENLSPGGTIEVYDAIYPASCDDGTLSEDSSLYRWSVLMNDAMAGAGRPLDTALHYEQQLADAGFIDIGIVREKWPTNRWPMDKKYKQIGIWAHENMVNGLSAASLAIFTRPKEEKGLGWTRTEVEVLLAGVRKDLRNTSIHAYFRIHSIYARKPGGPA